jgi:hypothetical protein
VNAGPDMAVFIGSDAYPYAYAANYESVSWTSSGDGSFSDVGILNPVYTPGSNDVDNGSVDLIITATGAQTVSDHLVLNLEIYLGLEQLNKQSGFVLSPNPSNDFVNISLKSNKGGIVEIYSVSGLILEQLLVQDGIKEIHIDLAPLSAGVYFVKFTNDNGLSTTQRLMVK